MPLGLRLSRGLAHGLRWLTPDRCGWLSGRTVVHLRRLGCIVHRCLLVIVRNTYGSGVNRHLASYARGLIQHRDFLHAKNPQAS